MLFMSTMPFALPNQTVQSNRCRGTTRACISQEKDNGVPYKPNEKKIPVNGHAVIPNFENPPLVSRLKALASQDAASFQFPGHNMGRAAPASMFGVIGEQAFHHDFTTFPGLDNLFAPTGPILEAQTKAAKLFGAQETWFLVGGTTCGIQASIMATCSPGDTLIVPRNCHKSVFSGMVLSGALPKYINPEYDYDWDIPVGITLSQVENAIKELDDEGRKASAVFITSPTYHGICSNLEDIVVLCHSRNIPVIVDEAHGAHLRFHKSLSPLSALHQGVDISIQSTHKVLGSLTQSSMLHLSGNIVDRERLCKCLATLQSTSPNFLLLASLDAARAQISDNLETIFNKPVELALETKDTIKRIPRIIVLNSSSFVMDPLRITCGLSKLNMSGFEAYDILAKDFGVLSELVGARSVTVAINLGTSRNAVARLVSGLNHLSNQTHNLVRTNDLHTITDGNTIMRLSPRDAFFACKKKVAFKESIGQVCGELVCPFPPGIPLLIPGEIITKEVVSYLIELKKKGGTMIGVVDSTLSSIVVCK